MAWTRDVPNYSTGTVSTECDNLKENNAHMERCLLLLEGFRPVAGDYIDFTYNGTYTDRIDSFTCKDSGASTIGSGTLTYDGTDVYQLEQITLTSNSKTMTIDITYSGSNPTRVKLTTYA